MRRVINLNNDWKFIQEDVAGAYLRNTECDLWEDVNIPHTWNDIDGIDGGNDYFKGACWYRKDLFVDKNLSRKKIYIELNGANSVTNVYLNGQHLGEHKGGYSTFRFDITDIVEFGKHNILAVKVDNSLADDIYPIWADFTFYGGLYRDVNLVVVEPTHFELMDHGSKGIYVSQDEITKENAKISVRTLLVNESNVEEAVRLWIDVLDKDGEVVKYNAKDVLLQPKERKEIVLPINIENPTLWHGVKNPYLYNVKVNIMKDNDVLDEIEIPTGLRFYKFDPKEGFFLNGEHMKLNGVSRHQDRKDKGWALSKEDHIEDMNLIKEVGANSIDLKGLNAKSQLVELIRQNYNHSSIVMWGVQNEIQIGGITEELRTLVQELNDLAKEEDKTRLTTQAQVMMIFINILM